MKQHKTLPVKTSLAKRFYLPTAKGEEMTVVGSDSMSFVEHANCKDCPLAFAPVPGAGNPSASLVIVSDAPGYHEERLRTPITGEGGELLDQTLKAVGESPGNVWRTNAVLCRSRDATGDAVSPPAAALAACRPRLMAELRAVDPRLITTLGANAAKTFFGNKTLTEIQGVVEHLPGVPAPVLPTYAPNYILNDNLNLYDTFLSSIKRSVRISKGEMALPDRNEQIPWKHVTSSEAAQAVLSDLLDGKAGYTLAIDVETSGLSIVDSELLQISIGNEVKGVSFEFSAIRHDPNSMALFRTLLEDTRFTWIIHNMSFDRQRFQKFLGTLPANDVDTMCLALGLTERGEGVGLKRLSREWLNAPYYESEVHNYLGAGNDWASVPRHILARYAVLDTVYTARVYPVLDQLCREEGTRELAYNLLMPAQRAFADFESHGVLVDQTYIRQLEIEWTPKVERARQEIQDYAAAQGWVRKVPGKSRREQQTVMVEEPLYVWEVNGETRFSKKRGKRTPEDARETLISVPKQKSVWVREYVEEPLNVNSPVQLQAFLFDHLRLSPPPEGRKTGKEFRAEYPEHPFTKLHGEYALMNRMLNTYVRGIGQEIASDGRVHPNFMLFGAVTGRLAIHNPALQTIPREDLLESKGVRRFDSIKRLFLPSPGFVWGETDYAQLELRVGWHLSDDADFGAAIMSGDFHRVMASKVFGIPEAEITDAQRHDSKRISFGIMYGRMAPAIAKQIGCSVETAQHYIDQFFAAAPRYREWYLLQQRQALAEGRSTTPFGRVRRWNLITRDNRQNVLNQAVNFPVQSTASDLNLRSAIVLNEWFKQTGLGHVLFLVHDSLCYECREGHEAEVAHKVRDVMTEWPFPSNAVLDVETKFGPSWGEVKVFDYEKAVA